MKRMSAMLRRGNKEEKDMPKAISNPPPLPETPNVEKRRPNKLRKKRPYPPPVPPDGPELTQDTEDTLARFIKEGPVPSKSPKPTGVIEDPLAMFRSEKEVHPDGPELDTLARFIKEGPVPPKGPKPTSFIDHDLAMFSQESMARVNEATELLAAATPDNNLENSLVKFRKIAEGLASTIDRLTFIKVWKERTENHKHQWAVIFKMAQLLDYLLHYNDWNFKSDVRFYLQFVSKQASKMEGSYGKTKLETEITVIEDLINDRKKLDAEMEDPDKRWLGRVRKRPSGGSFGAPTMKSRYYGFAEFDRPGEKTQRMDSQDKAHREQVQGDMEMSATDLIRSPQAIMRERSARERARGEFQELQERSPQDKTLLGRVQDGKELSAPHSIRDPQTIMRERSYSQAARKATEPQETRVHYKLQEEDQELYDPYRRPQRRAAAVQDGVTSLPDTEELKKRQRIDTQEETQENEQARDDLERRDTPPVRNPRTIMKERAAREAAQKLKRIQPLGARGKSPEEEKAQSDIGQQDMPKVRSFREIKRKIREREVRYDDEIERLANYVPQLMPEQNRQDQNPESGARSQPNFEKKDHLQEPVDTPHVKEEQNEDLLVRNSTPKVPTGPRQSPRPQTKSSKISDLVRDSKLETILASNGSVVRHISYISNPRMRQRRMKREETWRRRKMLGNGSFGRVWLEERLDGDETGRLRAVKEITKRREQDRSRDIDYNRELEAIAKFSHSKYVHCFVQSYGWYETEETIFITMEYVEKGDLQSYLVRPFPEEEAKQIAFQILEGLKYMHENDFAHRDLKPANILVSEPSPNWWVKISDFGISKRAEEEATALRTFVGTRAYLAPEILGIYSTADMDSISSSEVMDDASSLYTVSVDLWALGVIIFRLLTNETLFGNPRELARYVSAGQPFPRAAVSNLGGSEACMEFLEHIMARSPNSRPSSSEALNHQWLSDFQDPGETPDDLLEQLSISVEDSEIQTEYTVISGVDDSVASAKWPTTMG